MSWRRGHRQCVPPSLALLDNSRVATFANPGTVDAIWTRTWRPVHFWI